MNKDTNIAPKVGARLEQWLAADIKRYAHIRHTPGTGYVIFAGTPFKKMAGGEGMTLDEAAADLESKLHG